MPTLSELAKILIACRVASVERWRRAAEAGRGDAARTLDALAAGPPEWWSPAEPVPADGPPPGLTDYQRAVIELWLDGDEPDLPRQLARNHFLLLDKLGQGGQGEVYRARQLNPARFVAVKALTEESERRRERFEQEARAMMRVQHPSVARFHLYERVRDAAGHPTDEYLIAMEFVEGNDLARLVYNLGPLPWPFVARWAGNLLDGLAVIHQSGFIHRDVKPANVMIQGPLPEPGVPPGRTAAKLLDFGAAKPAAAAGTVGSQRVFVGTREYAPPEQWEERTVPASDLYALGATLFHALTGRPPYEVEGRDPVALMKAHARAPVPVVGDFVEDVPDEVGALVYRMLAKEPADRGTAPQLARAFRDILPTAERAALTDPAAKAPTPRPVPARPPAPRPAAEPEPKSPLHAALHPPLSLLEFLFLPRRLRPPAGREPPLPDRLAALARRPLLLAALLILVALLVWAVV